MEVLNDLLGYRDLKIFQDDEWFKFSLESVLLPNFVKINLKDKMIMDFCTGNAPIPLILTTKTKATIYAMELQKDVHSLALKSVNYNNLENRITLINDDIRNVNKYFADDSFDLVTVNPPYFKANDHSIVNENIQKRLARHEGDLNFEDVIKSAFRILKTNGRLALVHRTERFFEICDVLKKHGFAIKRLQFIYPNEVGESKLFMIEASKNGKDGLKLLPPLFVHNNDGTYRDEIMNMLKG